MYLSEDISMFIISIHTNDEHYLFLFMSHIAPFDGLNNQGTNGQTLAVCPLETVNKYSDPFIKGAMCKNFS